jgi:outer membrane protein
MKKLLLTNLLFLLCLNAFAQNEKSETHPTDKGRFIVDTSVLFSNSTTNSTRNQFKSDVFNIQISPKVAFFVVDRLAIGLETSYSFNRQKFTLSNNETSNTSLNSILIGPYIKYYFKNGIFTQTSLGFGTSKNKQEDFESKSNTLNSQIGIGYAIFLNNHISFEPVINYRYSEFKNNNSNIKTFNNELMLGAGLTIFL